jgi:hypothetical protein
MFPSTATAIALSPICDTKGDITVNIVSTPYFPASPLLAVQPTESKLRMRLFEDESLSTPVNKKTNVIYSSDWTTDSDPDFQENEFRWSATP